MVVLTRDVVFFGFWLLWEKQPSLWHTLAMIYHSPQSNRVRGSWPETSEITSQNKLACFIATENSTGRLAYIIVDGHNVIIPECICVKGRQGNQSKGRMCDNRIKVLWSWFVATAIRSKYCWYMFSSGFIFQGRKGREHLFLVQFLQVDLILCYLITYIKIHLNKLYYISYLYTLQQITQT